MSSELGLHRLTAFGAARSFLASVRAFHRNAGATKCYRHRSREELGCEDVGKQIGGFERLADDCELAPETLAAIRGIRNQYGRYTQWVFVIGSGTDKIVQMAEIHLSPAMLWANTNDTNEANARRLVENLRPDLPLDLIVTWLADKYPQGLTAVGLTSLSDTELNEITGGHV